MRYNYYKILGLPENASIKEIRKAYRIKAKLYHPDINDHKKAHEVFTVLNAAHTTLTDPIRRREYDLKLHYMNVMAEKKATTSGQNTYYTRPPAQATSDTVEPEFEPTARLFYSFFSAGTLCGLAMLGIPFPLDIRVWESPPMITAQSSTVRSFNTLWITSVKG